MEQYQVLKTLKELQSVYRESTHFLREFEERVSALCSRGEDILHNLETRLANTSEPVERILTVLNGLNTRTLHLSIKMRLVNGAVARVFEDLPIELISKVLGSNGSLEKEDV